MRTRTGIHRHLLVMSAGLVVLTGDAFAEDSARDASAATPETDAPRTGEVDSFVDEMDNAEHGWYVSWQKTGSSANEDKYSGSNNDWIDASDLHFHAGHGGKRHDSGYGEKKYAIIFENSAMVPSEAQSSNGGIWGNTDLEWIGFMPCSLLSNYNDTYKAWAASMDGLHLYLGFKTTSYSNSNGTFARAWAQGMKDSATVTQAWFKATDDEQESDVVARVLAEESEQFDDQLYGYGSASADPNADNDFSKWDHASGSPPFILVDPPLTEMRSYEVVTRNVDSTYVGDIAQVFGLGSETIQDAGGRYLVETAAANPEILEVHKTSGSYYYYDTSKLWNAAYELANTPYDVGLAYGTAESFYAANTDLYRDTVDAYEVESDTISELVDDLVSWEVDAATAVVYTRALAADAGQDVSIAGPGARTKLYLAADGTPMGAKGNWREVVWKNGSEMTPVVEKATAWSLFRQYGAYASLGELNVEYDQVTTDLSTATQGYYELSGRRNQADLIPVWIFKVDYHYQGELVLDDANTFVHAAVDALVVPTLDSWGVTLLAFVLLAAGAVAVARRGGGMTT